MLYIYICTCVPGILLQCFDMPFVLCVSLFPLVRRKDAEAGMKESHERELPIPWDREAPFTRLLLKDASVNGAARFHKPDLWHAVHLGIGKAFAASAFLMLAAQMPGSNIDKKFEVLNASFQAFCKREKITKYISRLDKFLCGGGGSNDAIGTWNKAAVTTNLCLFIEDFCATNEALLQGEHIQLLASLIACRGRNSKFAVCPDIHAARTQVAISPSLKSGENIVGILYRNSALWI